MSKIGAVLEKLQKNIVVFVLSVVLLIIFVATVGRYTGLYSIYWAEELARYSIIWMVYITGGLCSWKDKHFSVSTFVDMLPTKLRVCVYVLRMILMVGVAAFILYYGINLVVYQLGIKQVSAAMQIPFWFFYLAMPIGGFTTAAFYIVHHVGLIKAELHSEKGVA